MTDGAAKALWITEKGKATIRDGSISDDPDLLTVKTLYSGISRGTERLVFRGQVPEAEFDTMRAPFQEGSFAFPIKYGYSAVGSVQDGDRAGETVFALFPHQTPFAVPSHLAIPVPAAVPPQRAVLAANMETALNVVWDVGVSPGDRVVVIGAGVVGALAGYLCGQIPGTEVCLVDIDPDKSVLASALKCAFATPEAAPKAADVVIHGSATSEGLATAIAVAGLEATIAEASWYGTQQTTVPLGAAFHRKRLKIISSQVGRIPARKVPRWTFRRRLEKALELLADPALDSLISGETAFDALPTEYERILSDPKTLCHRIKYP
ncbi:MAG: zinc-binding alcohol dehydrogenase [Pseudomonadota bacterium]